MLKILYNAYSIYLAEKKIKKLYKTYAPIAKLHQEYIIYKYKEKLVISVNRDYSYKK